jgi:hypothetical protein
MAAFAFTLERADGTPADPPTLKTAVPNWQPGERSRSEVERFAWLPS